MATWSDFSKAAGRDDVQSYVKPVAGMGYDSSGIPIFNEPAIGVDAHKSVMSAAPARPSSPKAVIRARREPARGWYANLGHPDLDEALDAWKRAAKTGAERAVSTIAAGPTVSDKDPKPININNAFNTYTLWDTEKRYLDRYHVSDPYFHNILVGGANAGGKGLKGLSALPFGVLSKGPNRELFRNGEIKKIKAAIKASIDRGEHPRVVGQSWGASDVANLAKEYPGVPFIAIDPVSWTRNLDEYPDNLTALFPNPGTDKNDNLMSKLAPIFGHRWNLPKKGRVIRYDGGHVSGINEAIDRINYMEWAKRDPQGFFQYYDENGNRRPEEPVGIRDLAWNLQS